MKAKLLKVAAASKRQAAEQPVSDWGQENRFGHEVAEALVKKSIDDDNPLILYSVIRRLKEGRVSHGIEVGMTQRLSEILIGFRSASSSEITPDAHRYLLSLLPEPWQERAPAV